MIVKLLNDTGYEPNINKQAKPYIINKKQVDDMQYIYTLKFNTLNEFETFINSVRGKTDICFISKEQTFEINGETYDAMTFNGYYVCHSYE